MSPRILILISMVFVTGVSQSAILNGSGSFTGTEPSMTPRFARPGTIGPACGTFGYSNHQYQTFNFTSGYSGRLSVTFDPGTLGPTIYVTFHTAPFDPTNICASYIWGYGSSTSFTNQEFSVPANSYLVMVVNGVQNSPNVLGGPYYYSIDTQPSNSIPSLSEWTQLLLALMAITLVGWHFHRERS